MHLHADDLYIAHFCCALVNRRKLVKRDAELVLARASRNVLVRVRIDIGVGTQSNPSTQVFRARDAIDVLQLRFTLDVEAVNALLQCVLDFLGRLTHTGERAFGGIATSRKHAIKLATGNNVETCACLCQ